MNENVKKVSFFGTREAIPVSMEFEYTYPPYASYALLRLFIYLQHGAGVSMHV